MVAPITALLQLEQDLIQGSPAWVRDPQARKDYPLATPLYTTDPPALPVPPATLLDHRCPVLPEVVHLEDPQDLQALPHTTLTPTLACPELSPRPTASPMEYLGREANRPTHSTWVRTTLCSP